MHLLVTGGAGFIGTNLIRHLLGGAAAAGVTRVVNLDALTYAGRRENLADLEGAPSYHFVHGSVGDRSLVARLLREHRIDAIVHLAAESHVDRSIENPCAFLEANVAGTTHLLTEALHYWKELPAAARETFRFVHASTDEVFGSLRPEDPAFTEETPYSPRSPYAASKAGSDHMARAFQHTYGLPVLVTNCSNNYGPYQFPEKLIPLILFNALDEKPLPIYGDGLQVRDWLHVEDHCRGLVAALRKGKPGESYNFGGNAERPNLDLVRGLCAILDRLAPRKNGVSYAELISFVADRPGHDRRYAMNSSKAREALGWMPAYSLESGLEETAAWYLARRDWCRDGGALKRRGEGISA
jgi:dTDP-glucose 4,6-dehydratase